MSLASGNRSQVSRTDNNIDIYWEDGGEPEGVYMSTMFPRGGGGVRDNATQVRDQMQVIDIRVIGRVRQEETVRKLKNTFSASLWCIHLPSGHHLCFTPPFGKASLADRREKTEVLGRDAEHIFQ